MHMHLFQSETFHVDSGLGRWYLDGVPHLRKPGEDIVIPKRAFHCYENAAPEGGEDLAVSFRLDTQDFVMEERFFRNFLCARLCSSPTPVCHLLLQCVCDGH